LAMDVLDGARKTAGFLSPFRVKAQNYILHSIREGGGGERGGQIKDKKKNGTSKKKKILHGKILARKTTLGGA